MYMRKVRSAISSVLALIFICLCLTVPTCAASIKVVKAPDQTEFYEGVDWIYAKDGSIMIVSGNLNLNGTELSYGSKTVKYSKGKFGPNMYSSPASGKWTAGKNVIHIKCDDFDSSVYATVTVNFIEIRSIEIIRAPKTKLVLDTEWKMGIGKDVEMTSLDISGTWIKVTYENSAKTDITYPNAFLGWSIEEELDVIMPGANTLYITFSGHRAPFDVEFITQKNFGKGDVNLDSKINSADALTVLQSSIEAITLSPTQLELADFNKDGTVNSSDALMILQYVVGL